MTCGECANVTAPGSGFPNHVYCRRFLLHMEKREDASRCRDFIPKPQTNADRIRAMSDEELAEWMATKTSCMRCPVDLDACHNFEFSCEMSCEEILLSWLKSPVEEVDE